MENTTMRKHVNPTLRRTIATVATDMFISSLDSSTLESMNREAELVEDLLHKYEAARFNLSSIITEYIRK